LSTDTLVLLHPALMSEHVWNPVLSDLRVHHDVRPLALPGHRGGPLLDARSATLPHVVDGVERELDRLGIATAHLAGCSLGGAVSLELLRRGRARSVTAFSPANVWLRGTRHRAVRAMLPLLRTAARSPLPLEALGRTGLTRRLALSDLLRHGERTSYAEFRTMCADFRGGTAACVPLVRSLMATGPMEPIPVDAATPVTVVWAERDRVVPFARYGAAAAQLVTGAELVVLPGVGHVPMRDDPEAVVRAVLSTTARAARRAG
jgi:pimeloyl-ACP methyl ester carboxylesterase